MRVSTTTVAATTWTPRPEILPGCGQHAPVPGPPGHAERPLRDAGISVCCGGIIGMGEDRLSTTCRPDCQLANSTRIPDPLPINSLVRVPERPLADSRPVDPLDFVRVIAVARASLCPRPACGCRRAASNWATPLQTLCFMAGANSIFYGDKLLVTGNPDVEADTTLMRKKAGPQGLGASAAS